MQFGAINDYGLFRSGGDSRGLIRDEEAIAVELSCGLSLFNLIKLQFKRLN